MLVLGVDPGLSRCGYALVRSAKRGNGELVSMGLIKTEKTHSTASRLAMLHDDFDDLLKEYQPDALAIETVFFQKNLNTVLGVVQGSGVIQALSSRRGLRVAEYSPTEIKSVVAGDGAADKEQIQFMVARLLGLKQAPKPADVSDACAIALTYLALNPKEETIVINDMPTPVNEAASHDSKRPVEAKTTRTTQETEAAR